jgi:hypothetical protein
MLHEVENHLELKQVEINCIAASFSNLSKITGDLHRYLASRYALLQSTYLPNNIPPNPTMDEIPGAIAEAWKIYGRQQACVVMVVHEGETNVFDQRWLEYRLWEQWKIPVLRKTLRQIHESGRINPTTNGLELRISSGESSSISNNNTSNSLIEEVAVVYFRAGYSPTDYPSADEWAARELIEFSCAIKCPNVALQLVGTKKMQQLRALPLTLQHWCATAVARRTTNTIITTATTTTTPTNTTNNNNMLVNEMVNRVSHCFAGLWGFDSEEKEFRERVQQVRAHPHQFVLKPQREGGGNNYFDADILSLLDNQLLDNPTERAQYVLMERIHPPRTTNYILRNSQLTRVNNLVSELGIYSVFLKKVGQDSFLLNNAAGYLLRSKPANINDGGVAAGNAVLDSPHLTANNV